MASLTGLTVAAGYSKILITDASGLSGSATNIEDGDGTASPLYLTTSVVGIGNASPSSTLDVTGTLAISGDSALAGAVTIGGGYGSTGVTISAAGAISANSNLIVDGTSTLTGNTTVTGTLSVAGGYGSTGVSVDASGNVSANGTLAVDGAATFTSDINANGNIVGDDSTDITNIDGVYCDYIYKDGSTTTRMELTSTSILLRVTNVEMLKLDNDTQDTVFIGGDGGSDIDTKIFGNQSTHPVLFVEASSNSVMIGAANQSPEGKLHIQHATNTVDGSEPTLIVENTHQDGDVVIEFNQFTTTSLQMGIDDSDGYFKIANGVDGLANSPLFTLIPSNNRVGIGTAAPGAGLHVVNTTDQLILAHDADSYVTFDVGDSGSDLTITPQENGAVKVIGAFASSGPSGTFVTFADGDGTPSVANGNIFKHHASTQTITMFDDGIVGQIITVISTAAITYDVTTTNLKGGSTDLVTADGDVTQWVFDGTNWYLLSFMDISDDYSSGF
tara:strand:- start:505 stop:2010 length:1506 start_codon:yes stop_codon:yes gene_type:complete